MIMGVKDLYIYIKHIILIIVFIVLIYFFIKENMTPLNEFIGVFSEVMMPAYVIVLAKCDVLYLYS